MPLKIKVFGERNTNTNYLEKLIELNLECEQLTGVAPDWIHKTQKYLLTKEAFADLYFDFTETKNLGWKHKSVNNLVNTSKTPIITITKNPYSWLLSLYRNPYHSVDSNQCSFEEFITKPWPIMRRENISAKAINPIELWNLKNKSYLTLPKEIVLNSTTESLFENPQKVLEQISNQFNIPQKKGFYKNYDRSTKQTGKSTEYYRDYYLNQKWKKGLSSESIELINNLLDQDLMNHFGYEIL